MMKSQNLLVRSVGKSITLLALVTTGCLLICNCASADIRDQKLTDEQAAMLEKLDIGSVNKVLEILKEVDQVRTAFEEVRKAFKDTADDGTSLEQDVKQGDDPFAAVIKVAEFIVDRRETIQKFIDLGDKMDRTVEKLTQGKQAPRYDPDIHFDLSEENFRQVADRLVGSR